MALKIRLRRMGRKKAPHYRIVIAESTMPRDGRFVATIGHYNPTTQPATLKVDRERALGWLAKGAVPTDTVKALFRKAGVNQAEPSVVETAVAAVKGAAAKTASAAKGAAAKVAEAATAVAAAATEAVEAVVEKVTGGDEAEAAAEAPAAAEEAPAAEETAEAPAAEEAPAEAPAAEGETEQA